MAAAESAFALDPAAGEALVAGAPVLLLSGQGAQKPGMGADLADVPEVAAAFSCASDVLGYDLAAFVANAAPEELNDTCRAQPALSVLSVGIARALLARGVRPAAVLGFSLGQISALPIAGMLSDEAAFELVRARSEIMAAAAEEHPGVMSALLKADEESVDALCAECACGEVLVAANYNSPGQIVISGSVSAVERAEEAWAASGKRFSRLATSGAFHSPLMADAARELASYLEGVEFSEPSIPLICNVTAAPLTAAEARDHLARHLTSPVRFQQSVEALGGAGARSFIEAGFGGVLANLVKRIDKAAARLCVQDAASLAECVAEYGKGAAPATSDETEGR